MISGKRERENDLRDDLTGLPREGEFLRLAGEMLTGRGGAWELHVADLDQFRLFNQWYGWEQGDKVLAAVGGFLAKEAETSGGLAGYLGNDDFVLLIPEKQSRPEELYQEIHRIMQDFGASTGFRPSVGIARTEDMDLPVLELLDQARLAASSSKNNYRQRICYYTSDLTREKKKEYELLSEFHRGILGGKDVFFYLQPQVRASTGQVVGAEALTRWRRSDGSFISPALFVPILEKYGFVTDLDQYIWESVARWLADFIRRGGRPVPISLNVSQIDIFAFDVPAFLTDLAARYDLRKSHLKIEITESAVAGNSEKVRSVIQELRQAGFTVLMDDFGSGYSSLNMLHEMDLDIIKIDANFLRFDQQHEKKGAKIVESVIGMTKSMGTPVLVEGVENQEQVDFLMALGCRYMQGFYYYRPMPADEFERLIADPDKVDYSGFRFKANEQFRLREFLDENIYNDSMLNTILGPVAFYYRREESTDIIRYNEQFYELMQVGDQFDRLKGIERFMPPGDADRMREMMDAAMTDSLNGSSAVISFFRPDGGMARFLIHLYYLGKYDGGDRFYGACRDVTEISLLQKNLDLISRQFSDAVIFVRNYGGKPAYEVVAQGIPELGLTKAEMEKEMNSGKFFSRVLPEHRSAIQNQWADMLRGIDFSAYCTVEGSGGEQMNVLIETEAVDEDDSLIQNVIKISYA